MTKALNMLGQNSQVNNTRIDAVLAAIMALNENIVRIGQLLVRNDQYNGGSQDPSLLSFRKCWCNQSRWHRQWRQHNRKELCRLLNSSQDTGRWVGPSATNRKLAGIYPLHLLRRFINLKSGVWELEGQIWNLLKIRRSYCTAISKPKFSLAGDYYSPGRKHWALYSSWRNNKKYARHRGHANYTASFQVSVSHKCGCRAPILGQLEDAEVWQILGWKNREHDWAYCSVHGLM